MRSQQLPAWCGAVLCAASLSAVAGYAGESSGAAVTFGAARPVSAADGRAMAPDVAVGPDGAVHVLWVNKAPSPAAGAAAGDHGASDELWYRRSPGGAADFGPAVRVNDRPGDVWGFAVSKPELAIGRDGVIHVMYPANDRQAGSGKSILVARYTRSTDAGQSFEPGRTLNSPAKNDLSAVMHGGFAAAHAFGTLVTAGRHDVHVYWIDTRDMGEKDTAGALFGAVSRDGGATFAPDRALYRTEVCPCCQLAAAAPGEDIYLASREAYPEGLPGRLPGQHGGGIH